MPRKLKTFITNLGFFELALAAPSMKAALEAWGMGSNAIQQGFAKETGDPKIIAATMANPGVVLRRPVGGKGEFKENAELPKDLWKLTPQKPEPPKPKSKLLPKPTVKTKAKAKPGKATETDRDAILSFQKAKERRDRLREQAQATEDARREKENARIERAVAKADAALERARARHEDVLAAMAAEQEKLDRRAAAEKARWDSERAKLEDAQEGAKT